MTLSMCPKVNLLNFCKGTTSETEQHLRYLQTCLVLLLRKPLTGPVEQMMCGCVMHSYCSTYLNQLQFSCAFEPWVNTTVMLNGILEEGRERGVVVWSRSDLIEVAHLSWFWINAELAQCSLEEIVLCPILQQSIFQGISANLQKWVAKYVSQAHNHGSN